MAGSNKSKPSSRTQALTGALSARARPLEVVLKRFGLLPEGTPLERRLINTVVAKDKATVIKVYREEVVRDDAVSTLLVRGRNGRPEARPHGTWQVSR